MMIKQSKKLTSKEVLSTVKKYPYYSLDKLKQILPGISRHALQRLLEKNNLSRIEQRLAFAKRKADSRFENDLMLKPKEQFTVRAFINKLPIVFTGGLKHLKIKTLAITIICLLITGIIFISVYRYTTAKAPSISLAKPEEGYINKNKDLFVSGKVYPANSQVSVNGEKVALNGDGSFTAIINIPMGRSSLEIEAVKDKKRAKLMQLVQREPNEQELEALKQQLEKEKQQAADEAAELTRKINDLWAAKNADGSDKGSLRVMNNQIKENAGFYSIEGEVVNRGNEPAGWVMITANLFDSANNKVDSKMGFATDFGEMIAPGGSKRFETQATKREFDHYELEISWEEEGDVAGEASESGELAE